MANKFQIKRTSTSGVTPNTTNVANTSYIAPGELAVNMADKKLFTANTSGGLLELGSNLSSLSVTGTATLTAVSANSSLGSAGQVLTSNGSAVYWGAGGSGGSSLLAGDGLTSNTTHYAVNPGTGIVANSTGTHVNATYIATVTVTNATNANNADYLDGQHGSYYAANSQLASYALLSGATFSGGVTFNANATLGAADHLILSSTSGISANGTFGTAGQVLHSNGTAVYWAIDDNTNTTYDLAAVANTAANAGRVRLTDSSSANDDVLFVGSGTTTVSSNSTAVYISSSDQYTGTVTSVATSNGVGGGSITTSGTLYVVANNGLVANSTGVFVNAGTGIVANSTGTHVNTAYIATVTVNNANNADYLDGQHGSFYTNATNITTGTLPYAQIPTNVTNTTADFTIGGAWTFNANVTLGAADHLVLSSTSGISANGSYGSAGQVLHSNGSAVYWSVDDNTNTTYDLAAVANSAANAGRLRLTDSSSANDDVLFVGAGTTTVSSNSTQITISSSDQYVGTVTSVSGGSGLTGSITTSGSLAVGAGVGITVNADDVAVNPGTGIVANSTGTHVNAAYIATITVNNANNASYLQTRTWEAPGTIGSTTANSGAFTTLFASANLNVDNGTLFVDTVNNRVGIGNTAPAGEALDVRGNIRVGGSDTGPNYIAFRGTTGDSPGTYNHTYVGERIHTPTESSELLLFKGNDPSASGPDRVRIAAAEFRVDTYATALSGDFETVASNTTALTNKFIVASNGNVGIGDTSPSDLLVVNGRSRVNGTNKLAFGSASGGYADIGVSGATTGTMLFRTYDGASFQERMRIAFDTGNVGIGNTSPTHTLSVGGTSNISGNASFGQNVTITGNLTVSGTTTTVDTTNLDVKDAVIRLNSGQSTPLNDIGILMQRYATANSTNYNVGFAWDEGSDRLIFGTTPEDGSDNDISFSSEWMTIAANGNVGIGTTSPSVLGLQVTKGSGVASGIVLSNPNNNWQIATGTTGNFLAITDNQFAERVRIDNTGNVGIGTQNPNVRLEVSGGIADVISGTAQVIARSGDNTNFNQVRIRATASESRLESFASGTGTSSPLVFHTGGSERMRVDIVGNVAIGNTVASNKLFVTGDIGLDGISVRDTATTTTTATTQVTLFEYPIGTYDSCDVIVKAVSGGQRHTTKLLVTANSTVAIATEYGTLQTGSSLYTVDCDVSGSNTRIRITPASATSTVFKASYELITA